MQSTMQSTTRRKWQFLREVLAGTTQDFTQGSLTRGIALLAIPAILEMMMESDLRRGRRLLGGATRPRCDGCRGTD